MGPGAVPPELVRPVVGRYGNPPTPTSAAPQPAPPVLPYAHFPAPVPRPAGEDVSWGTVTLPGRTGQGYREPGLSLPYPSGPPAVLGSFDDQGRRRCGPGGWIALAVAVVVIIGVAGWLSSEEPLAVPPTAVLRAGDCLSSDAGRSVIPVDCGAADVDFRVVRMFDTAESASCTGVADVALTTRESRLLCLDYVAEAGDCLYAGGGGQVGKAPCPARGQPRPNGLYRVLLVLRDTTSDWACPPGTRSSLIHHTTPEVLCLGRP